jgi:hypothetical protein
VQCRTFPFPPLARLYHGRSNQGGHDLVVSQDTNVSPNRQVIDDMTRALGPNHPDTLIARRDLAAVVGGVGQTESR